MMCLWSAAVAAAEAKEVVVAVPEVFAKYLMFPLIQEHLR
tara:strand:+ start:1128 stop:1247 length:120 start_codon:yes stop_codon:yes gene_type:complete